jgi:plasmid replication initiation protein
LFSLSKKPDMKTRRYENSDRWVEVRPSAKGLANVFDRDILIYCISQLVAAKNAGKPISKTLRLKAYDLLICTNRDTSGHGYDSLRDAFTRLQGMQIETNVVTGGIEEMDLFSLINRARVVRQTRDGRMLEVEIELSKWVFEAVDALEVLTLDRRYFQLAKPLERRLYEIARKHCGNQARWQIGLDNLRNKCGSQSTSKEFRRMLDRIIEADKKHDHMPEYAFEAISQDQVVVTPKARRAAPALPFPALHLNPDTYEQARALAPGWDVHALEANWREWTAKNKIALRHPDAAFLAFCKRRGKYITK